MKAIDVFSMPSGLGGVFTVSVEEELGDQVDVRVWYGRATNKGWESWEDFDGQRYIVNRSDLKNPRKLIIQR